VHDPPGHDRHDRGRGIGVAPDRWVRRSAV
jgi:hypothetical protein